MNKVEDNKAVVGRWFTDFWGKNVNLAVIDEIAAPDMLLKYSLHEPRRGRDDIKAFMKDFRAAFPDLNFWGTADLIAEGDYVVGQWEGGGTHTGPAFKDFLIGGLPAATGRKMHFTGTTVLKVVNGKIAEEVGLDDGVTALTQRGLIKAAWAKHLASWRGWGPHLPMRASFVFGHLLSASRIAASIVNCEKGNGARRSRRQRKVRHDGNLATSSAGTRFR